MDWLIGIVTGVVAGVVSSAIFFIFLALIKPKIKISKDICFTPEENSSDPSKGTYRIKIVNKSRVMLTNIRYIFLYVKNKVNEVNSVEEIPPLKNTLKFIDKYGSDENYSDYAVRIAFDYDPIKFPLDNGNELSFIIFAEHSRSNKSRCYKQTYTAKDIKKGKFAIGESTKIV